MLSPVGENSCQLVSVALEETGAKPVLPKYTESHVIGLIANPAPACSDREETTTTPRLPRPIRSRTEGFGFLFVFTYMRPIDSPV